eukprot:6196695-Pleurochrysis_carterae.AAC.4
MVALALEIVALAAELIDRALCFNSLALALTSRSRSLSRSSLRCRSRPRSCVHSCPRCAPVSLSRAPTHALPTAARAVAPTCTSASELPAPHTHAQASAATT